jgi:hypothetical protein
VLQCCPVVGRNRLLENIDVQSLLGKRDVQCPVGIWISVSSLSSHFPSSFSVGLYPPRAKLVIQRHLSSLTDNEQADIFERVQVTLFVDLISEI